MKRVIVETPYAGITEELDRNVAYARACLRDCLQRGETPFASHLLYTQEGVLLDTVPEERRLGIEAGFAWREVAQLTAVYVDRGISDGMIQGILDSLKRGIPVVCRILNQWARDRNKSDDAAPEIYRKIDLDQTHFQQNPPSDSDAYMDVHVSTFDWRKYAIAEGYCEGALVCRGLDGTESFFVRVESVDTDELTRLRDELETDFREIVLKKLPIRIAYREEDRLYLGHWVLEPRNATTWDRCLKCGQVSAAGDHVTDHPYSPPPGIVDG